MNTCNRFFHDLRFATRQLFKNWGYALNVVLILSLSIAMNTVVFGHYRGFMKRLDPVSLPNEDRIMEVLLMRNYNGRGYNAMDHRFYEPWSELNETFAQCAFLVRDTPGMLYPEDQDPSPVSIGKVTPSIWNMIGAGALEAGRPFTAADASEKAEVLILSASRAKQVYGSAEEAIDQRIRVNNRKFTVIGVLKEDIRFRSLSFDLLIPLDTKQIPVETNRSEPRGTMLTFLADGITPLLAAQVLQSRYLEMIEKDRFLKGMHERSPGEAQVAPITRKLETNPYTEKSLRIHRWLALMGLFLYGVALANTSSLTAQYLQKRHREYLIRAALGATRADRLLLGLCDTLLLILPVFTVSTLTGLWLNRASSSIGLSPIPQSDALSWILGSAIAFCAFSGLVTLLMMLRYTQEKFLMQGLKDSAAATTRRSGREKLAVVIQLSMSMILLCAAVFGLIHLHQLASKDYGFQVNDRIIATLRFPEWKYGNKDDLKRGALESVREKIAPAEGVLSVSAGSDFPFAMNVTTFVFSTSLSALGMKSDDPNQSLIINLHGVDSGFFRLMGIRILQGRSIEDADAHTEEVEVVIDEFFAKMAFNGENPIDRTFPIHRKKTARVVGICQNVAYRLTVSGDPSDIRPHVFSHFRESNYGWHSGGVTIHCKPGYESILTSTLRAAIQSVDPDIFIDSIVPYEQSFSGHFSTEKRVMSLSFVLGFCALLITIVGVYSYMQNQISRRLREMGLRLALGDTESGLAKRFVRSLAKVSLAGIGIGTIVCATLVQRLPALFESCSWHHPLPYIIGGSVILITTLAATIPVLLRLRKIHPWSLLREE